MDVVLVCMGYIEEKGRIFRATKQVSLRAEHQTFDHLKYLGILRRQPDAQIVTNSINTLVDTVRIMAPQANPALVSAPQYRKNGGRVFSLEEQQAVQTIQQVLAGFA